MIKKTKLKNKDYNDNDDNDDDDDEGFFLKVGWYTENSLQDVKRWQIFNVDRNQDSNVESCRL